MRGVWRQCTKRLTPSRKTLHGRVKAHKGGVLSNICGVHTSVKIKVHFTL